jgi:hypothetical protein
MTSIAFVKEVTIDTPLAVVASSSPFQATVFTRSLPARVHECKSVDSTSKADFPLSLLVPSHHNLPATRTLTGSVRPGEHHGATTQIQRSTASTMDLRLSPSGLSILSEYLLP